MPLSDPVCRTVTGHSYLEEIQTTADFIKKLKYLYYG